MSEKLPMLTVILTSVIGSILFIAALGGFVYWIVGKFGKHYDANIWRNPKTGRLVIPADEIVWSEDGT